MRRIDAWLNASKGRLLLLKVQKTVLQRSNFWERSPKRNSCRWYPPEHPQRASGREINVVQIMVGVCLLHSPPTTASTDRHL